MRDLTKKIAFVDPFGMSYRGDTLENEGLGGSESSTIYMARELAKLGHDVTVFNNSEDPSSSGFVKYWPINKIAPGHFDILISLRTILPFVEDPENWNRGLDVDGVTKLTADYNILWKHDTYVPGDEYIAALLDLGKIDKVFTLSDWHTQHTKAKLGVRDDFIFQTRNGIETFNVNGFDLEKDPNLFVWNAAAFKGLSLLIERIWPIVKKLIPEARLVVIGGYYKGFEDDNFDYITKTQSTLDPDLGISFTGIVTPEEAAAYMAEASFMLYPPVFPETFGISTLEAQCYGALPITYNLGALETTAMDEFSFKCPLNPSEYPEGFASFVFSIHQGDWESKRELLSNYSWETHSWNTVAREWEQLFINEVPAKTKLKVTPVDLNKTSILIAVPSAIHIEPETFKSIYDLIIPDGYRTDFHFFFGYLVDQVRNTIAKYAVDCGYDYVLCVDSDIELPNDALVKMLKHDKDVVTGIYRMRREEQVIEVYDTNYHNIPAEKLAEGKLLEIGGCGFGCALVKTQVFKDVGYPYFVYHQAEEFCNTFSEDNDFCLKARDKGYHVYCDTSILCRHKGTVMWEITL